MTGSGVNQLSPRRDRPPWCDFRASTNAALARYEWQPTQAAARTNRGIGLCSAPTPAPYVNLEQLDQLGEILGNVSVRVGTYTGAVLTIGANPGDLLLTVAADPESGFPLAPGTSIPAGDIHIQGKQGASGNLTVPVNDTFDSPLTVSTSQNNALDLEFDLAHPAFIVGHTLPAAGATL